MEGLLKAVIAMGVMYACGALCTFGYNRIMVKVSQKVIQDIRNDLFAHVQKLPLKYFDAHTHGELMSRFTNDVDTVQEAMNNSFAMIIQSFIMLFGHSYHDDGFKCKIISHSYCVSCYHCFSFI